MHVIDCNVILFARYCEFSPDLHTECVQAFMTLTSAKLAYIYTYNLRLARCLTGRRGILWMALLLFNSLLQALAPASALPESADQASAD